MGDGGMVKKSVRAISIVFNVFACSRDVSSGRRAFLRVAFLARNRPAGETTRCNYSKDFLVPVEGVSLILSRVYTSALHLIASLHLHKGRSTPLT